MVVLQVLGPRADPTLATTLSLDRPALFFSRESGDRSGYTSRLIHQDLTAGCLEVQRKLDLDLTSLVPSVDVIAAELQRGDVVESVDSQTGQPFTNVFAPLDCRPQAPVIFIVSTGSAHKIDVTTRSQPAIVYLAAAIERYTPAIVLGKRRDRWFRTDWAQGPFWMALAELEARAGNVMLAAADSGMVDTSLVGQMLSLAEGNRSGYQASALTQTSFANVNERTRKREMSDGWTDYYLAGHTPPGFVRLEVRTPGVVSRQKRMYLDDPAAWPHSEVLDRLPDVKDSRGRQVSQVDVIRWFLANAGRPGATNTRRLARELTNRFYSTAAYRSRHGADAVCKPGVYNVQKLLDHLPLYETGTWRTSLYGRTVEFKNLFPLDGRGWATAADFVRIRHWMTDRRAHTIDRAQHTFSGLPATAGGVKGVLRPTHNHGPGNSLRTVRYRFYTTGEAPALLTSYVHLRHEWLAESILNALLEARCAPVPVHDDDTDADPEGDELRDSRDRLERSLATNESKERRLRVELEAYADGQPVVPARIRQEMYAQIVDLKDQQDNSRYALQRVDAQIKDHEDRRRRLRRGLEVARIIDITTSLKNSSDTRYLQLWRECLRDLTLDVERGRGAFARSDRVIVRWSAVLRVTQDDVSYDVPVTGNSEDFAISVDDGYIPQMVQQLRDGRVGVGYLTFLSALPQIRVELGIAAKSHAPYLVADDPALLRMAMAVMHPVDPCTAEQIARGDFSWTRSDREWASTFRRPDLLAERMHQLWTSGRQALWIGIARSSDTKALVVAATHEGRVEPSDLGPRHPQLRWHLLHDSVGRWTKGVGMTLQLCPCPQCGSTVRVLMRIQEPAGLVCVRCRADEHGVTWPAALYDRYVTLPEAWTAAGVRLNISDPLPDRMTERFGRRRRNAPELRVERARYRPVEDLSAAEIGQIVERYTRKASSMTRLALDFGIHTSALAEKLGELGVRRSAMNGSS